jgi:hypothetical protein
MNFWEFANERPAIAVVLAALLTVCVVSLCRVMRRALTRPPIRIIRQAGLPFRLTVEDQRRGAHATAQKIVAELQKQRGSRAT